MFKNLSQLSDSAEHALVKARHPRIGTGKDQVAIEHVASQWRSILNWLTIQNGPVVPEFLIPVIIQPFGKVVTDCHHIFVPWNPHLGGQVIELFECKSLSCAGKKTVAIDFLPCIIGLMFVTLDDVALVFG